MGADYTPSQKVHEYQPPAVLNQPAPVQNTWYPILDTTANVLLYYISVNVEDANETLELRITIDGQVITGNIAATHSRTYGVRFFPNAIDRSITCDLAVNVHVNLVRLLDGRSVRVEVRKTTALGAGNLTGIVVYGRM